MQSTDYVDPYTGGSRYTPGMSTNGNNSGSGVNVDPFTGKNYLLSHTSSKFHHFKVPVVTQQQQLQAIHWQIQIKENFFPKIRIVLLIWVIPK